MQFKKVINFYKFKRVLSNKRTITCKVFACLENSWKDNKMTYGLLLDNHLYIKKEVGVYPHTKNEYYAYFISEVGGIHYRKNNIMFYKLHLTNKF